MIQQAAKITGMVALRAGMYIGAGYLMGVGYVYGKTNTSAKLRAKRHGKKRK